MTIPGGPGEQTNQAWRFGGSEVIDHESRNSERVGEQDYNPGEGFCYDGTYELFWHMFGSVFRLV